MRSIWASIPALMIIGAILIPLGIYAILGVGETVLTGRSTETAKRWRPWLWLALPLLMMGMILLYPLLLTIFYAFRNAKSTDWVGMENFVWSFSGNMGSVMANSLLWLIVLPVGTVVLSLLAAILFDRVKYERLAITIILLPTAISFTAASIIWRQFYSYQPPGSRQLGAVNAAWTLIPGNQPVAWLLTPTVNSLSLIFVALWASIGVATLIVSAAVKNVPQELAEAAKLDGAGELRIFYHITLPSILPALLVVFTTAAIFALKVFDIVFVMTNGNFGTNVVANRMYAELFTSNNLGHASAIAVLLLLVALPVALLNMRQFRKELRP